VLSLSNDLDQSVIANLFEKRLQMSSEGIAYLLLAAVQTIPQDTIYSPKLVLQLESYAKQTDRTAFFENAGNPWNFSSDIRSTAVALSAFYKQKTIIRSFPN
jgi:DNA phosphorothioation-dependent restriction protein DptG